ncbi:hypothetical protein [Streptomyces griseus]|uniref:hypothetical protein n=1 Tax=Streptomyces griseus TaxID=1911 RepID=UPI00056A1480|nr:hypothetical protein [Streptomyces griseus]
MIFELSRDDLAQTFGADVRQVPHAAAQAAGFSGEAAPAVRELMALAPLMAPSGPVALSVCIPHLAYIGGSAASQH